MVAQDRQVEVGLDLVMRDWEIPLQVQRKGRANVVHCRGYQYQRSRGEWRRMRLERLYHQSEILGISKLRWGLQASWYQISAFRTLHEPIPHHMDLPIMTISIPYRLMATEWTNISIHTFLPSPIKSL